jgi:hypothetical protein
VIMPACGHNNDPAAAAASVDHAAHAGLLDDLMARVAPCSARRETRLTCRDMVNGLLSELEDYNCWTLAEAAGHASPYRIKQLVVYAAAYETVDAALTDLDAIEQLHKDEVIGQYDAAVIDQENGKPHVVKRMDRPHVRVIPEWFGSGTLPRKELHEAAEQLTANQAGLIAVGEPTIEKGLDKALTKAAKVVKRTVEATTDQITSELQEALKG